MLALGCLAVDGPFFLILSLRDFLELSLVGWHHQVVVAIVALAWAAIVMAARRGCASEHVESAWHVLRSRG